MKESAQPRTLREKEWVEFTPPSGECAGFFFRFGMV
jgi:hypothetical protein